MRNRVSLILTIAAVAIFLLCVAGFIFHDNTHVYVEDYSRENQKMAGMVSETEGWQPGDDRLSIARGGKAHILYDFYKSADHEVFLDFTANAEPGVTSSLSLHFRERHISLGSIVPGGSVRLDLTSHLKDEYGVFRLRLDAEMAPDAPAPIAYPFDGFTLTLKRQRTIHGAAIVFLSALAALSAIGVAVVVIHAFRLITGIPDTADTSNPNSGLSVTTKVFVVSLILGIGWVASHPGWWERKKFDDVRAISNAAVLLDNGFDTKGLFFRGVMRPAFLVYGCPVVRLHPQTILRVQKTPSDFYAKVWEEYDRDNETFGRCLQLEFSLYGIGMAAICLILVGGLTVSLGGRRAASPLAILIAAFFLYRCLTINLTQIFTLFINLCAVAGWWMWYNGNPSRRRSHLLLAGFLVAMAILAKTSTLTSLVPIGLHQGLLLVFGGKTAPSRKRLLIDLALYWGVALAVVVVWFQGFTNGLIAEYSQFWEEVAAVQELQQYPSTSIEGVVDALRSVFGWGGLAILVGALVLFGCRIVRLHPFVFFWILGAATVLQMPFIFPRFFQYFIPAVSIVIAVAVVEGIHRLRTRKRPI